MDFFKQYSSNSYAGSGNQLYFNMPPTEIRTGRVFYKITVGGNYHYSVLFSNIIDSTFADGSVSHKNLICDSWTILEAKIGKCKTICENKALTEMRMSDDENDGNADILVTNLKKITFNGKNSKEVMPGEFFSSDPVEFDFMKNEYLCLEITFTGNMIPYHEETLLPVFIKNGSDWVSSKHMPFAGMIGCDRNVKARVAYIGDSITQGIGTKENSYLHWNAILSEKIGSQYAFWNLGLGYGRAEDAASDGAWLYKAKQNDMLFVCYGVNDILQGRSEEQIIKNLTDITDILIKAGKHVVLQTVPPFDYSAELCEKWKRINLYIKNILSKRVDSIFDNVPLLCLNSQQPHITKFGGHPNAEGCKIWAEALYEHVKNLF